MQSGQRRTYQTRSAAARRVASQERARQRRRAQRTRRFQQRFAGLQSYLAAHTSALPTFNGRSLENLLRLPSFSGFAPSKLLSLSLLVTVIGLVFWMHDADSFFVYQDDVHFEGTSYLRDEELYPYCDVDAWSIFWLDPALIREQVLRHPYVADAAVTVRWPADVTVRVTEVQPVALWSTEAGGRWLLEDGAALAIPEGTLPPAFQIVDPLGEARAPGSQGERIDSYVLRTALDLQKMLGLPQVWYNRTTGLNFQYPGAKTWVYWGDGLQFAAKLQALEAAQAEILAQPEAQRVLDVSAPSRPYFRSHVSSSR